MRILSIDPGYDRIGVAILEKHKGEKEKLVFSDCLKTNKEDELPKRLLSLGEDVRLIIEKYTPEVLAIETLYVTKNQKTAIGVAQARGVILYLAATHGMGTVEFTPQQIKQAVTGYGRATKKQVMDMVPRLITIKKEITIDDEMDAIAVGITALAHLR